MADSLPKFRQFLIHCQESFPFGEDRATSWTDDLSASKGCRQRATAAGSCARFVALAFCPADTVNAIKSSVRILYNRIQRGDPSRDPVGGFHDVDTRGASMVGVSGIRDAGSKAWFVPSVRDDQEVRTQATRPGQALPDEKNLEGAAS